MGRVIGIDAAGKLGWVGIVIDDGGYAGARTGTLVDLVAWAEPIDVIGIDIPIGHGPGPNRQADVEARQFVGPRASSVFPAPPTEVLDVISYAAANELLTGGVRPMISKQAWALVPKMIEAATLAGADRRVYEVHPEVSFRELAGEPIRLSKKSWNGLALRRRLLADAGIVLPGVISEIAGTVSDDVVDAAIVAWSARRIATRAARTLPDPPEEHAGRQIAIWI
jgi:predicted RNase H-like nuclease